MMRKMSLMLQTMQMPRELKEQDLISRVGKSENGNGEMGCSHNLSLLHDNPTDHDHPSTIFNSPSSIPPQIGQNHGLTIGASAFWPWVPSYNQVTCTTINTTCEQVGNSHGLINGGISFWPWVTPTPYCATHTNNLNNGASWSVGLLGSTPGMASLCPPHPIIPTLAVKYGELDLSLAPSQPIYDKKDPVGNKNNPVWRVEVDVLNGDGSENGNKVCKFCKTNNTSLWRNGTHGRKTLCNACGIWLKKKQKKSMEINMMAFLKHRNIIKKQ